MKMSRKNYEKLRSLFWSKVRKAGLNECWIWRGRTLSNGYGVLWSGGRMNYAHRLAYFLAFGVDFPKLDVCHACDIRNCVNPNHLFPATRADNLADCRRKGRMRHPRGEESKLAKLNWQKVRFIRSSDKPLAVLARKFHVTKSLIVMVRHKKTWVEKK